MAELESALENEGRSAPGIDSTTYEIIKNCPKELKNKILTLLNEVWEKGTLQKQFKHAIIVPIQKPGKGPENPASYRPISLTSHLGKTLETIISKRLNYFLEKKETTNNKTHRGIKKRQTNNRPSNAHRKQN